MSERPGAASPGHIELGRHRGGLLFVLSGPSAVGKDELLRSLLSRGIGIQVVVTATTRPMRANEAPGRPYHFLDHLTFESWITQGRLLEWTRFANDHYYGTPRESVKMVVDAACDAVLKIEVDGAARIRELLPGAILVFLAPPSTAELALRMRGRDGSDAPDLKRRLARAEEEMRRASEYDYLIINETGHLNQAVDEFAAIVTAERCRVTRRLVTV